MNNLGLGILIQAKDRASMTFDRVGKSFDSLSKKSDELSSRMQASSRAFFAGIGMMGAGAGMLAFPVSFAKSTFETQKALGELKSLGIENLDSITLAARKFSNDFSGTTTAQFITAAYDIKSGISSLSDEAVGQFTRLAALTGKATKASTEQMTSLFATAYGIYKDAYSNMSDMDFGEMFSGGLSKAVMAFKTTGPEMQGAIERLGAAATTAGISMEEQLSVLGMLQATMSGSEAGTRYTAFLKNAAQAGQQLGIKFTDANNKLLSTGDIIGRLKGKFGDTLDAMEKIQLQKAFGTVEAIQFVDLFYNKTTALKQNIVDVGIAMKGGTELTNTMAKSMNQDMGAQLQVLAQRWQNLKETLGEQILPILVPMGRKISDLVSRFQAWAEKNKPLAQTILKVVMAVGAFLVAAGGVIAALGSIGMLSVGLSGLPALGAGLASIGGILLPVIGIIAGVAVAGYILYKAWQSNFGGIRDFLLPIWEQIKAGFNTLVQIIRGVIATLTGKPLGPELQKSLESKGLIKTVLGIANVLRSVGQFIVGYFTGVYAAVKPVILGLIDAVKPIIKIFIEIGRTLWNALGQIFALFSPSGAAGGSAKGAQSWGVTVGKAVGFLGGIIYRTLTITLKILTPVLRALAFVIKILAQIIVWVVKAGIVIVKVLLGAVKWVMDFGKALWQGLGAAWEAIKAGASVAFQAIKMGIQIAANFIVGVFNWLKSAATMVWNAISAAATWVFNGIRAVVQGAVSFVAFLFNNLKSVVTTVFNGILAVATAVWNAIKAAAATLIGFFAGLWEQIRSAASAVWEGIKTVVSGAIEFITGLAQSIAEPFIAAFGAIKEFGIGVWNSILDIINQVIDASLQAAGLFSQAAQNKLQDRQIGAAGQGPRTFAEYKQGMNLSDAEARNKWIGYNRQQLARQMGVSSSKIKTDPALERRARAMAGVGFQSGGEVVRGGVIPAIKLHEGEVITPTPAVRKITSFADRLPGPAPGAAGARPDQTTNHISISLPNVREVDRGSIKELADEVIRRLELLQKRKRDRSFANDFNPSLGVGVTT